MVGAPIVMWGGSGWGDGEVVGCGVRCPGACWCRCPAFRGIHRGNGIGKILGGWYERIIGQWLLNGWRAGEGVAGSGKRRGRRGARVGELGGGGG